MKIIKSTELKPSNISFFNPASIHVKSISPQQMAEKLKKIQFHMQFLRPFQPTPKPKIQCHPDRSIEPEKYTTKLAQVGWGVSLKSRMR